MTRCQVRSRSEQLAPCRRANARRQELRFLTSEARGPGARRRRPQGAKLWRPCLAREISTRGYTGRGDDGRLRALRRRVTLIYGGYRDRSRQSTHDSASSGGRAVYGRELGRESVSHALAADPHNRASDHPPSSRSVTGPRDLRSSASVVPSVHGRRRRL